MSQVAQTAVTARFAAIMAWTANSGSRCSAISWPMKPSVSRPRLATKRHWRSIRTSRPGSRPAGAVPASPSVPGAGRWLAVRAATACITDATP